MQTTLSRQAFAIKLAMQARSNELNGNHIEDKQWKALNDAYSTLVALQLNKVIQPLPVLLQFVEEKDQPMYYVRDQEILDNFYKFDIHPADHKNPKYKAGQSKGRKLGLEEAGWKGVKLLK